MGDSPPLRREGDGMLLDLWVVPGANRTALAGIHDEAVRVRVAAPAAHGDANRALVRFLARRLGCDVTLVRGFRSRRKRVRVDSTDLHAIASRLGIGQD